MTREEVKAQLSKSPLDWDCTEPFKIYGGSTIDHYAEIIELASDSDIHYTIRERFDHNGNKTLISLYFTTIDIIQHSYSPYEIVLVAYNYNNISIENIKTIAENHRIDFICNILGIKK